MLINKTIETFDIYERLTTLLCIECINTFVCFDTFVLIETIEITVNENRRIFSQGRGREDTYLY